MARVVRPTAFGTPEVLAVTDVVTPVARPGEVVVRVRAVGVNPVDWKLYSGAFHAVDDDEREAAGLAEKMPAIGLECAGVVHAVGDDVRDTRIGEHVIVYPVTGAYADYVVVPESSLVPKPDNLGWAEAGGLMLAGTTAAHALEAAGVKAGESVLIHGGSGGVGIMAMQLARHMGAEVVATASERNHACIRDFGATPVAYGEGLLERLRSLAPDGFSAAVDAAGTEEALDTSLELVADPGRISSIAGSDRRFGKGIKLLGYGPGQDAGGEFRAAARAGLAEKAAAGDLRVVVAETFSLTEAAVAHRASIEGHHGPGKLVLLP